jgi:hypothetical protein
VFCRLQRQERIRVYESTCIGRAGTARARRGPHALPGKKKSKKSAPEIAPSSAALQRPTFFPLRLHKTTTHFFRRLKSTTAASGPPGEPEGRGVRPGWRGMGGRGEAKLGKEKADTKKASSQSARRQSARQPRAATRYRAGGRPLRPIPGQRLGRDPKSQPGWRATGRTAAHARLAAGLFFSQSSQSRLACSPPAGRKKKVSHSPWPEPSSDTDVDSTSMAL